MAKVKKHITENEDRVLRELRAVTDGQLDDDVIGALLEQARSQRAASSVAFYARETVRQRRQSKTGAIAECTVPNARETA